MQTRKSILFLFQERREEREQKGTIKRKFLLFFREAIKEEEKFEGTRRKTQSFSLWRTKQKEKRKFIFFYFEEQQKKKRNLSDQTNRAQTLEGSFCHPPNGIFLTLQADVEQKRREHEQSIQRIVREGVVTVPRSSPPPPPKRLGGGEANSLAGGSAKLSSSSFSWYDCSGLASAAYCTPLACGFGVLNRGGERGRRRCRWMGS